jgi:3-isopropylmalate dehydratase small subunit
VAKVIATLGDDVSTDVVYPGRYMATVLPSETPQYAFADDVELNRRLKSKEIAPGSVIVAGENFGCGSSREVAVQALIDYGFRVVVARSFAEIFEQNAYKNRLLPAIVDSATYAKIVRALDRADSAIMTIDIVERCIRIDEEILGIFGVDEIGLEMIVEGTDEFWLTARFAPDIQAARQRLAAVYPWLDTPRQ